MMTVAKWTSAYWRVGGLGGGGGCFDKAARRKRQKKAKKAGLVERAANAAIEQRQCLRARQAGNRRFKGNGWRDESEWHGCR